MQSLLDNVRAHISGLFKMCESVAMIDMVSAFAQLVISQDYSEPSPSNTAPGPSDGRSNDVKYDHNLKPPHSTERVVRSPRLLSKKPAIQLRRRSNVKNLSRMTFMQLHKRGFRSSRVCTELYW